MRYLKVARSFRIEDYDAGVRDRVQTIMKKLGYVQVSSDHFVRGNIAGWFSLSLKDLPTHTKIRTEPSPNETTNMTITITGMWKYGLNGFWENELQDVQEMVLNEKPLSSDRINRLASEAIKKNLFLYGFGLAFWVVCYFLLFLPRALLLESSVSRFLVLTLAIVTAIPILAFSAMIVLSVHYYRRMRDRA